MVFHPDNFSLDSRCCRLHSISRLGILRLEMCFTHLAWFTFSSVALCGRGREDLLCSSPESANGHLVTCSLNVCKLGLILWCAWSITSTFNIFKRIFCICMCNLQREGQQLYQGRRGPPGSAIAEGWITEANTAGSSIPHSKSWCAKSPVIFSLLQSFLKSIWCCLRCLFFNERTLFFFLFLKLFLHISVFLFVSSCWSCQPPRVHQVFWLITCPLKLVLISEISWCSHSLE